MEILRKAEDDQRSSTTWKPGTWWRVTGYDGEPCHAVFIACAKCGKSAILRDDPRWSARADGTHGHDIAADGTVTPSIVCPHQGCDWHVWGKLDGWTPSP